MSAILKGNELALPQLPAGWQILTATVLADGTLAFVITNVDLQNEWRRDPNGAVLGKPFDVAARAMAQLMCFDGKHLVEGPFFLLETPFPSVDRFEDGRWLIVAARTSGEPNARILSPDGQLLACFMLGDGIEHVGVDRHDQIWVGWFDEGIFGNHDWRVQNEEWPPSSRSIGMFSALGDYQRLSDYPENAGIVADCYAMNIAEDGVWACPYMDFPIFQLQSGCPVRWWSNEIAGVTAMAVTENHVLLSGGYGSDANRLALLALTGEGKGETARPIKTWHLPLVPNASSDNKRPDSAELNPWQAPILLAGRRDTMHLVQDGTWYRWRVSDCVSAISFTEM